MRVTLRCRSCDATREITDEPRDLIALACTACGAKAEPRAAEDLASALEDALAQLGWLAKSFAVEASISTERIPEAFVPQWDDSGDA